MPVIPMCLVNGSDGIVTGWYSSVPNYDPWAIIANICKLIQGGELDKITPHYYGWRVEIDIETGKKAGSYSIRGTIERINETTLNI